MLCSPFSVSDIPIGAAREGALVGKCVLAGPGREEEEGGREGRCIVSVLAIINGVERRKYRKKSSCNGGSLPFRTNNNGNACFMFIVPYAFRIYIFLPLRSSLK